MQWLVDLTGTVASTYTRIIWILILGGIAVVAIVSLLIGYATPAVVEEVGERAERISDKAIEAARDERRAEELADEGWGYSDTAADTSGDEWGPDSE